MSTVWIAFSCGAFIGATFGILAACVVSVGKLEDEREYWAKRVADLKETIYKLQAPRR